jgi:acyl-CoA thioesterase-1|tara:strand:+ start:1434 stop:2051 length:618 start_codon:yes stop_codon:yes gene_type:complete
MKKLFFYIWCFIGIIQVSASAQIKVMLFGDSLMAGYGLTQNYHLDKILEKKFTNQQVKFINAGVSGDTTKGGLERLGWSLNDNPDVVILGLGANDMLRGINPDTTKKNLDLMIQKIKEQNIAIILTGMLSPPSYGAQFSKKFNNIYPDLARKYKVTLYPFLLEGVALKPELNLKDGKHPNIEGVKIIAQNLYPYILKEIENLKGL